MPTRKDIRIFLQSHFSNIEDPQTIEDCTNAYIKDRKLGTSYYLKPGEIKTSKTTSRKNRVWLRNQITQELGVLKQMGVIGRARYGVYLSSKSYKYNSPIEKHKGDTLCPEEEIKHQQNEP